jgi:hypothetical protein
MMRDYCLTAPAETDLIAALPACRVTTDEGGEQWMGGVIAGCTRWMIRPQYDAEGNLTNTPETVSGYHLILRAETLPEAAQGYIVADPGDIEPLPFGGLLTPEIPAVVSMRQARLALLQSGLLPNVEAAIAGIADATERSAVSIEWEYSATVERSHAWVQTLGAQLGLFETDLDNLFTLAITL